MKMNKTTILTAAAVLSALIAMPALAHDTSHKRMHRHGMASTDGMSGREMRGHHSRRVYVRTAGPVALSPLDFFIFNGNQPYFDGYNGQPGYMGYYGHGRTPTPIYYFR
jgi:hypothetical protein